MFDNNIIQNIIAFLSNFLGISTPWEILRMFVDISIVAFIIYKLISLLRETRAMQLAKGIIIIFLFAALSSLLGLRTISYILSLAIQLVGFALVVLFQPELRSALERIGRSRFGGIIRISDDDRNIRITSTIEEIIKSCTELAKDFTGALIVVERNTRIGNIIQTGTQLNSSTSSELLINIFTPNTPLHDGAVIIRDNTVMAAACFLPLTDNPNLNKQLGTRHRAAIGMSEVSDAIAIVVSEESGKISFAMNGGLTRNLTTDMLRKALNRNLIIHKEDNKGKKLPFWKGKAKNE